MTEKVNCCKNTSHSSACEVNYLFDVTLGRWFSFIWILNYLALFSLQCALFGEGRLVVFLLQLASQLSKVWHILHRQLQSCRGSPVVELGRIFIAAVYFGGYIRKCIRNRKCVRTWLLYILEMRQKMLQDVSLFWIVVRWWCSEVLKLARNRCTQLHRKEDD